MIRRIITEQNIIQNCSLKVQLSILLIILFQNELNVRQNRKLSDLKNILWQFAIMCRLPLRLLCLRNLRFLHFKLDFKLMSTAAGLQEKGKNRSKINDGI